MLAPMYHELARATRVMSAQSLTWLVQPATASSVGSMVVSPSAVRSAMQFEIPDYALDAHTRRMLALEAEYLRRFPERSAPDPMRTRAGSRHAATSACWRS